MSKNQQVSDYCDSNSPLWKNISKILLNDNSPEIIKDDPAIENGTPTKTMMYSGGKIYTMQDGETVRVEAIGFNAGKVVAIGSLQEVTDYMQQFAISDENIIKLDDNQTLLPGLIEPHVHIVPTAMMMDWIDFGPFNTNQQLKKIYTKATFEKELSDNIPTEESFWILGHNLDPSLMPASNLNGIQPELAEIDVDTLDEQNLDCPILVISASMHTGYVNTKALRAIYECSENNLQTQYSTEDEYIASIKEQGALQEMDQITPAFNAIPAAQKEPMTTNIDKNLTSIFETANQRGITLMYDAGMNLNFYNTLQKFRNSNTHNIRIGYAGLYDTANEIPDRPSTIDIDTMFTNTVKIVVDGSNQGLTGYQYAPYLCKAPESAPFGIFKYETDTTDNLQNLFSTATNKGWQLMVHGNGDHAIDIILQKYKNALNGKSGLQFRHRIEHCSLLNDKRIKEMIALGISPSFLIGHVGYWGYAFQQAIFGADKTNELDRCQSMLTKNARITFHSDMSVTPIGPLRMMEQAVTRIMEQSPDAEVLNSAECVSREQALKAITYDAAWQCNVDDQLGSLEIGKAADYVILENNPLTLSDPTKIRDIKVLETWVGGKRRYCDSTIDVSSQISPLTIETIA